MTLLSETSPLVSPTQLLVVLPPLLPRIRRPCAANFDRQRFTFGRLRFQTTPPFTHAAAGGVHLEARASPPAAGAPLPDSRTLLDSAMLDAIATVATN